MGNPGGPGRWIIQIEALANQSQDVNNTVRVFTGSPFEGGAEGQNGTPDPDTSNNRATDFIAVTDVADLQVNKTAMGQTMGPGGFVSVQPNRVTAGRALTYTLTVDNAGPSTAENVVVQDRLPGWIVVNEAIPSQGSCTSGTPGDPVDKLTCGLGSLAPGAGALIVIHAHVSPSAAGGSSLENDALVFSDILDPNNADNFVTNLTAVDAWADLSVAKTQEPDVVLPGEDIHYTLSVMNSGPSDAAWAALSDLFPAEISGVTWACTPHGNAICPASGSGDISHTVNLPAGWKVVYTVQGVRDPLSAGKVITNTASVTTLGGVGDPDSTNNSATVANRPVRFYLPLFRATRTLPQGADLVVKRLHAGGGHVEVVIQNQGSAPVVDAFWIDVYVNPASAPGAVNELWSDLGPEGLVWGIPAEALPLEPAQVMTVTVGDEYYWPSLSVISWLLPAGTPVYAQVDSSGRVGYGAVLEGHEEAGMFYNNVLGPELSEEDVGAQPSAAVADPSPVYSLPPRR